MLQTVIFSQYYLSNTGVLYVLYNKTIMAGVLYSTHLVPSLLRDVLIEGSKLVLYQ